jgi:hypothetical protein
MNSSFFPGIPTNRCNSQHKDKLSPCLWTIMQTWNGDSTDKDFLSSKRKATGAYQLPFATRWRYGIPSKSNKN